MTVMMQPPRRRARGPHSRIPSDAAAEDDYPVLDRTHINQLCTAIGPARVEKLLDLLAVELADRPALIRNAILAGDLSRARHESHSFKGATTSVGAMALGKVAAAIEQAPDLEAMAAALPALAHQAARTRHAITNLLATESAGREAG